MMLEDLLSQACLALGTAICGPCSVCALLATVLSHLLGGGRGRKSAPWSWLPEERARKEAVGRPQGEGISWSLLEAQGCLSILFMVLDFSVV